MSVLRPPNYCFFCGELIKEIHDKQEGVPDMMKKIGDNFLRYEDHVCNEDKKKEHTEKMDIIFDAERILKHGLP